MRAIVYCRVSTKEQAEKGYSLEAQEEACRKFAENNGYEVDKVFVEWGESAKTQNQTQLQKNDQVFRRKQEEDSAGNLMRNIIGSFSQRK